MSDDIQHRTLHVDGSDGARARVQLVHPLRPSRLLYWLPALGVGLGPNLGFAEALARQVAGLQPLTIAADLVDLAEASSWGLPQVARLYYETGARFAFDRLRAAAGGFTAGDPFERLAVRRLLEDLLAEQAAVTRGIMAFAGSAQAGASAETAATAVASWAALRREAVEAAKRAVEEIEAAGGGWTFAKLTIANAALRELAASARLEKTA